LIRFQENRSENNISMEGELRPANDRPAGRLPSESLVLQGGITAILGSGTFRKFLN
jgi:hypothetical protein